MIRRYIKSNDIIVVPYRKCEHNNAIESGEAQVFPVYRNEESDKIFSDWLLEKLRVKTVDLYLGYKKFKINISDLFRLLYHNQALDPNKIYKAPDAGGMVSDSDLVRKAIFELWMGKAFSDYYDAINESKVLEKEKNDAAFALREFKRVVDKGAADREVKNLSALSQELQEIREQEGKLLKAREAFKKNRTDPAYSLEDLSYYQELFASTEADLARLNSELFSVYKEKASLVELRKSVVHDAERISKILYAHNQLNLFSVDTCPFCLEKVDRAKDRCICGTEIDEAQYERFFYTSEEYGKLLKSKKKTTETIELAIRDVAEKEARIKREIADKETEAEKCKEKVGDSASRAFDYVDVNGLDEIDDKILQVRTDIKEMERRIDDEKELDSLQKDYDRKRENHGNQELLVKRLEVEAEKAISEIVKGFSETYNDFMTSALADCRSARVSNEDYMPIIDNGYYREASSAVPKRLMYFLTMLHMSLESDNVLFPRLLLVDTPETGGIEADHLIGAISQIDKLEDFNKDYQVILSTGISKYPDNMKENVVVFLDKQNRLLKKKGVGLSQ